MRRRGFTGLLLALLFRSRYALGGTMAAAHAPEKAAGSTGSPARMELRKYRADAAILVLGLTIYRRAGVGGGQASVEEVGEGPSTRRTFFFAAGSDPKTAHGVSRLGWIREVVLEDGANPREITYFGVLTASSEESLEHARKSAAAPPPGRNLYSAVDGRNSNGHSRSAVAHFEFASDVKWSDERLINAARSSFDAKVEWRTSSWPAAYRVPPTFLYQLAALFQQRAPRAVGRYVYNEQEYRMELEVGSPAKDGRTERLLPVRGKVRNLRTGRQTVFRLWLADTPHSIVPVRIEFQPRSFLRLTFEAVAG
jgi:hypothetical protein